MSRYYERLKPYMEKAMALQTALTLFQWDNETAAPKEAGEYTSQVIGTLSDEYYKTYINDEVKYLLDKLAGKKEQEALSEQEKAIVKEIQRMDQQLRPVPAEEYKAFSTLTAKSSSIWAKAKADNDYKKFAPVLEEMIEYQKRFARYRKHGRQKLYDILLNDFEPGFNMEQLDIFFGKIKTELVPFIQEVEKKMDKVEKSYEYDRYPIEKQKEFCNWISSYLGFNFNRGILSESAHPFTTNLHNHDVRYTNHYTEEGIEDSIFSAIHETGHALYEFGVKDEYTLTPVGTGTSMGMHESQSRFFENVIGKSEEFWTPIYSRLVDLFPEQLKNTSVKDFIKGVNKSKPSLIRTQSDELTYPLHILVRYEIEKEIIEHGANVKSLPKMWNQKYKEYLGVEPETDTEGILQDVHWSTGDFGYFPSYALGSAVAAQIYYYMKSVMPLEEYLKEGNLLPIREFLKEKVHQYGKSKTTNEILKEMTGEEFTADYYIKYLKEKYQKIYNL
ncbi:carboxypeptidase M32 [[Clostridium] polysaccharolyticum]|uniref:Metal-dependent carboxypeptidase n=1 Tax=[Clostridium] polysaccharolyticum TaxID=29364 RepID=A0A1I0F6T9_9FIRM|nr:carboxypeptidase M32 [[Clostridium] polysaccharolyticum]SET53154.1 carboxypeptidase Taq [[Clostridium] polysaccharolyticum]